MPLPDPRQLTAARIQRTDAYAAKVQRMFSQTVNELAALPLTPPAVDKGEMFSFDNETARVQRQVEQLLRRLHATATMAIRTGIELEWEQANRACDTIIKSQFAAKALKSHQMRGWNSRNGEAMRQFINRSECGMNLSDRIWRTCRQLRDEMEVALTISIGEGEDAGTISRRVRQYLNDPDLMFRRFRYKDANGVWQSKWKKRIKDPARPGKYRFIDCDKDSYRDQWTGPGYYKSSAKNAMRVARTETNIAYRRADHERWQGLDFVLGQQVQLSKNHPCEDICDTLAGDYPKDFVFDGWHPQCFCFVTPILLPPEEMAKMNEAFARGEQYTPNAKPVTEYPAGFRQWVKANETKIAAARKRGTEPYFIRNNAEIVDGILNPQKKSTPLEIAKMRHDARTPEQEEAIRSKWQERQRQREEERIRQERINTTANNVLGVANARFKGLGIDTTALEAAIQSGDIAAINAETRALAKLMSEKQMQVKQAAITRISKNMPDVFKPGGKYVAEYGDIEFSSDFFDLLVEPPKIELKFDNSGSEEVFGGKLVRIANHTRLKNSPWFRRSLIYHECGHAIGDQRGIIDHFTCSTVETKLSKLRAEQIKRLKKKEKAIIVETIQEYDFKTGKYINVKKRYEVNQSRAKTISEKLRIVGAKIFFKPEDDPIFARLGLGKHDILEQIGAVQDTLKSLIRSVGSGHTNAYFSMEDCRQHEYLAHCFENRFAGNRVFQLYLPDIYAEMISFVNSIKKP